MKSFTSHSISNTQRPSTPVRSKLHWMAASLLAVSLGCPAYADSTATETINGNWIAELKVNAKTSLELVLKLKQSDNGFEACMDVPAQGQFDICFPEASLTGQALKLGLPAAAINIEGQWQGDAIHSQYQQGGFSAPVTFERQQQPLAGRKPKPQELFSADYQVQDVSFASEAGITLAGTLSLPKTPKAVAILLSGSGPSTRDAEAFGHKIFMVLAHQLSREDIAVLRFDDRGVGQSGGDFASATSLDFATDALAAFEFIRAQPWADKLPVGFVGHSEGGLIGTLAAAKEPRVNFLVSLAGLGTSGEQILIDQSFRISQLMGMDKAALEKDDRAQKQIFSAVRRGVATDELTELMVSLGDEQESAKAKAEQLSSPWFRYFVSADPAPSLAKLTMPVLALNGELDVQVLADPNIKGFKNNVKHELLTTRIYPGLNHLFQPAKSGLPNEYVTSEISFSDTVSLDIANWVKAL